MMLLDIYEFMRKLEQKIGNNCRVMLFIAFNDALSIQVNFMENFQYRKTYSRTELEYIYIDDDTLLDYIAFMVKNFYKNNTDGDNI